MAIRGTSAAQDGRYFAQEKKLLAKMTFPKCFDQRVDMRKVQRDVIDQWVTERLTQLLGFEDDIVVSMAINLLDPKGHEQLDPKQLQVALTGFLEKQAGAFMEELWQLLLSAQRNATGIPSALLEKKKLEMQAIAHEKEQLKKVLAAKRAAKTEGHVRDGDQSRRQATKKQEEEAEAPLSSVNKARRSPSEREDVSSRKEKRRSASLQKWRRSPVRHVRRSPAGSTDRARERHSTRSRNLSKRESRQQVRRSPSSSSSDSQHDSASSSSSPSPARRRPNKSRRKTSTESGSGSE
ncbi:unnamed protein product [Hyaloperonospora brassicae]|uniref:PWI domain-containing protein n=1 Tax=Hyaloperonospora brassicae TaxID=162125 RepID=A0AAV0UZT1_HYABA|nr:unnamed protein product [Hyaloperonospora brassicae]